MPVPARVPQNTPERITVQTENRPKEPPSRAHRDQSRGTPKWSQGWWGTHPSWDARTSPSVCGLVLSPPRIGTNRKTCCTMLARIKKCGPHEGVYLFKPSRQGDKNDKIISVQTPLAWRAPHLLDSQDSRDKTREQEANTKRRGLEAGSRFFASSNTIRFL